MKVNRDVIPPEMIEEVESMPCIACQKPMTPVEDTFWRCDNKDCYRFGKECFVMKPSGN